MGAESTPAIEVDPRAVEFVQEHGGSLYVYVDDAGLEHVRTDAPYGAHSFQRLPTGGIRLFVDKGIDPPSQWQIVFHHMPHPHVAVNYNGGIGGWRSLRFPLIPGPP